ncbi:metallophosphoesterase [Fibrobacter sp. UWEL]|uniref:metallophosphoesterase n=1 Tax=Fibrobacter sp. UWEL TaxID=1896209 RepID=UPI000911EF58|nr:metallophosphoesterase [Fibrobacter sp. UWEL]SHL15098.1 hypothetical protein SAMN05720468_1152 [Fibrobacter sp. UWEL]
MIAFLILPFVAVLVLYLNLRKVADGSRGVLMAGLPIILTFGSFFLARQNSAFFSWIQCIMVIWLCQALWMFLLWDLVCVVRWIVRRAKRKKGHIQYKTDFVRNGVRAVLAITILLTFWLLAYGIPNNDDYKTRTLDVPVTVYESSAESRDFKAVFFSDLHIDPIFQKEKLERLIAQCDSIKPSFILFGGDLADVHDAVLTEEGYDKLLQRLAATARIAAVAINGNHEAFMERSGSDPEGFLRKNGWLVLDDSSACVPTACFTGRRDYQKARVFDEPRKSLKELAEAHPMAAQLIKDKHFVPWIIMDHQPKGVEEDLGEFRPDLALSGHTHDGQFFPGNILINWIWPLAYGEGFLNDIHWLVSSGVDSWGPPVRAGSDTEIWVLNFKLKVVRLRLEQYILDSSPSAEFLAEVDSLNKEAMQKIREEDRKRLQALIGGNARFSNTPEQKSEIAADSSTNDL